MTASRVSSYQCLFKKLITIHSKTKLLKKNMVYDDSIPFLEGLQDIDDARLNHNSWTVGGTYITSFSPDQFEKYEKAILVYKKQNGDADLVLSKNGYMRNGRPYGGASLHEITKSGDLSKFWRIFDSIKPKKPTTMPEQITTDIKAINDKISRNEAFAKATSETLIASYELIAQLKNKKRELLTALENVQP